MEMIELKKMLQLDINIEKRIYKRETIEKAMMNERQSAPDTASDESQDAFAASSSSESQGQSYVKTEHNDQVPYENKLRLKVENNPFSGSFFQRIVKSISGEEEDEDQERNESSAIDHEAIRRELYDEVSNDKHDTVEESDKNDNSDDEDDGSSSSSSDDDSDSEDDDEEHSKPDSKPNPVSAVSNDITNNDEDDDDDAFPMLPGVNDDGVPSIPTTMLIKELENDEKRLDNIISDFIKNSRSSAGDCSECGHSLSADNFVLHYGMHLEEVKSSKKKLIDGLDAEEQTRLEMEAEAEQELPDEDERSYQEPTPPPTPPPTDPLKMKTEEDSVEARIDKLQENQKRLSREIVNFMAQFQRGAKTLECSECGESVVQTTSVAHFKSHINDLNRKIETLVTSKKHESKRKRGSSAVSDVPRKKMKETPPSRFKSRHSSGDADEPDVGKGKLGSEEERKKMYKRIYGRKKYQYRIQNRSENVTVSEEEIDAEIAKENAKFSGIPSSGSVGDTDYNLSLSPSEMLRNYVQFGSKEYKHEFKKVRDFEVLKYFLMKYFSRPEIDSTRGSCEC